MACSTTARATPVVARHGALAARRSTQNTRRGVTVPTRAVTAPSSASPEVVMLGEDLQMLSAAVAAAGLEP
jgi:hypothetical protein